MSSPVPKRPTERYPAEVSAFDRSAARWREEYSRLAPDDAAIRNRSGIEVKPLYGPDDWSGENYLDDLGFPGQLPLTRGIYPSMHRGRPWSQRQLVGLGTPEDYNARLKQILAAGSTAVSLIPCNSVYRGYDVDEVDPLLLGTCGATVNTVEDMDICFRDIALGKISIGLNDPLPFTLLALLLAVAKRRDVPWGEITGTSNQSDYISHFVANHMFFRVALPGSRRILSDHIEFMNRHVPGWNPVSVVGQHMQQAGATPAQAMAFTLCTAIQYAEDCRARGMDPDAFLPRFTFFFDISISFFEEIAKLRAGRRLWAKIARDRLGAKDPRSWRFKFHAQTSGLDLTRAQPLNNIARSAIQAMAGIFGGLQSLHTDAYDEVLSTPTVEAARIAVATQNILRDEAHLADVIDPVGGSYYVEALTDQMEEEIERVIGEIDAAGGMYAAVDSGLVQTLIGESALAFQREIESGAQKVVGVNAFQVEEDASARASLERPDPADIDKQIARYQRFKAARSRAGVQRALDALARAANDATQNSYEKVVDAALAGVTHGEICTCLRREMGFGQPLCIV
jgi:methylmalonyl-CoA mutase N-terminal domain/subunit